MTVFVRGGPSGSNGGAVIVRMTATTPYCASGGGVSDSTPTVFPPSVGEICAPSNTVGGAKSPAEHRVKRRIQVAIHGESVWFDDIDGAICNAIRSVHDKLRLAREEKRRINRDCLTRENLTFGCDPAHGHTCVAD